MKKSIPAAAKESSRKEAGFLLEIPEMSTAPPMTPALTAEAGAPTKTIKSMMKKREERAAFSFLIPAIKRR